jgi:hypothetical protein
MPRHTLPPRHALRLAVGLGAALAAVTVALLWRVDRTDRTGDDVQVAS